MAIIDEEYKQEIKCIFGEIYEEIFKNKLTFEIAQQLNNDFKTYKNKHDEELRKSINDSVKAVSNNLLTEFKQYKENHDKELKQFKNEINTISENLQKMIKDYKNEFGEQLSKDIKDEIIENFSETKKSIWISTRKILRKYLFHRNDNGSVNADSQINVMKWLIIISILFNIVTLIIVVSK